jgi:hypothetical protein
MGLSAHIVEESRAASQAQSGIVDNSAPNAAPNATVNSAPAEVYGDCSYGTGEMLEHLQNARAAAYVKVQAPGRYDRGGFYPFLRPELSAWR